MRARVDGSCPGVLHNANGSTITSKKAMKADASEVAVLILLLHGYIKLGIGISLLSYCEGGMASQHCGTELFHTVREQVYNPSACTQTFSAQPPAR